MSTQDWEDNKWMAFQRGGKKLIDVYRMPTMIRSIVLITQF